MTEPRRAALLLPALLLALAGVLPARALDVTTPDGVRLRVHDGGGAGEPVLLLHGLGASVQLGWDAPGLTAALRKAGLRVVAFDLRGHGQSTAPDAAPGKEPAEGYGLAMVEDCVAVLDALHLERAHVVGYSLGGLIALSLAARHPDRVRSVVLGGMGWLREGSRLQDVIGNLQGRGGPVAPAGCLAGMAALALTAEQVKAIAAPVSVVVGDRDPCLRLYVRPLEGARPDWPVTVVPGEGHVSLIAAAALRERLVADLVARAGR